MPFQPQPPSLSWLSTGTKYAGLHTQWIGYYLAEHTYESTVQPTIWTK